MPTEPFHLAWRQKGLAAGAFKEPVSLVLYDLTSVYFEGAGPEHIARYGHSRDHRSDRPQIILAVATDTTGTPLHLSVLRGNRADTSTLQGFLKIIQRRFGIREAVFVFDGGMSSKINLEAIEGDGLNFVTRLSNATLEALLKELPDGQQLELGDANRLVEIEHEGKRHVIAGGPWCKERDRERRDVRICFPAYWISARLAREWRTSGETGEVTRILRELQTIRLGQISLGKPGSAFLARLTKVPAHLNALLAKLKLLSLFAAPPKWAAFPAEPQL